MFSAPCKSDFYLRPIKLREANVFTGTCYAVVGGRVGWYVCRRKAYPWVGLSTGLGTSNGWVCRKLIDFLYKT